MCRYRRNCTCVLDAEYVRMCPVGGVYFKLTGCLDLAGLRPLLAIISSFVETVYYYRA